MSQSRKSRDMARSGLLLRNEYPGEETWGIPIIQPTTLEDNEVELIAFPDAKVSDCKNAHKYVHCFLDDYKVEQAYWRPNNRLLHLARYRGVLTPDYSLFPEMPRARQLESIFHSRWCGAHWQHLGLTVIPTICWSDETSFDFCFLGAPQGGTVAVSTLGCHSTPDAFIKGYLRMMEQLQPQTIICYGNPISGMTGNIIYVNYEETTRRRIKWVDEENSLEETIAS